MLLVILLVFSTGVIADEFVVRSFKPAPADLSAIQFEFLDVNDEKCAIIKVRTDLRNLTFDCGKNLAKDIEMRNGEYWLYVSPGEKRITIVKDGFITLHYPIQIPIVSSRVYVLEITNKEKAAAETGSMIINTSPQGAEIKIKELSGLVMNTPAKLDDYPAFPYSVSIFKERYRMIDTILTLHPGEEIVHNLVLEPAWGDLIIIVDPIDADIYVDDVFFGTGSQQLVSAESGIDIGKHKIKVIKQGFTGRETEIEITRGNNGTQEFVLHPIQGFLNIRVTPADAIVLLNGLNMGSLPFADSLQVGFYELDIRRESYLPVNKTIEIKANQRLSLFEELQHTKTVRIISNPLQAEIYQDGNFLGRTPAKITLTYGTNHITLKKANFEDLTTELTVTQATERFDLNLEPKKYAVEIASSPSGASIYVDNVWINETPANLKVPYGTYHLMIEKSGYFRKRKTIPVKHDKQRFNFRLKTLKHLRVGFIKGAESWGGELTYVDNLVGMGLGYFKPPHLEFAHEIDHPNIEPGDYYDLEPSGLAGKVTNSDSLNYKISGKVHIFFNKAPTFSAVLGMAVGRIHYSEVYQAENNYEYRYSSDYIRTGEYFSVAKKGNLKVSPILGVSARIFRYLYANAEYWFFTEKGTSFFIGGGICIPLR
ncbi:MAG: PEGA domain-containing protein [Bacteroidales bacterium]|nr:PEGA domain-containing protein [Bacteroidales bacterium]